MLYIQLFHGRTDPQQEMDDWGTDGPVFGPYEFVHTTYASHLKLGRLDGHCDELFVHPEDMVFYDGVYYGDWSIFDHETLKEGGYQVSKFDSSKAELPKSEPDNLSETEDPPIKVIVYVRGGVCQDVRSNLPDDSWEYALIDYDNEPNLPENHIPFSRAQMKVLPSMVIVLDLIKAARDVVENWESGDLAGSVNTMAKLLDQTEFSQ